MNKYLLMSAAAVLSTAATGVATSASATTVHFSGYCDDIVIGQNTSVFAGRHTFLVGCGYSSGRYGVMEGLVAKGAAWNPKGDKKKAKGNVNAGDTSEPEVFGTNIGLSYDMTAPVKGGSSFYGWASFSGTTSFNYISGVMGSGPAKPAGKDGKVGATTDKLAALAKARKN